jgi:hypothetical protein
MVRLNDNQLLKEAFMAKGMAVAEPTNDGKAVIDTEQPYTISVEIEGTADLLLHGWSVEAVAEKSAAKKGSAGKKTDNLESYVRRDERGVICIPSEYLRMSVVAAAKFRQDPRSPRKSASDLYKAGVVGLTSLAPLTNVVGETPKVWDFEDARRVQVQRNGITRVRPAFRTGWKATFLLGVLLPEYIPQQDLREVISQAGRLVGVGDFRPTFGRFSVTKFEVMRD